MLNRPGHAKAAELQTIERAGRIAVALVLVVGITPVVDERPHRRSFSLESQVLTLGLSSTTRQPQLSYVTWPTCTNNNSNNTRGAPPQGCQRIPINFSSHRSSQTSSGLYALTLLIIALLQFEAVSSRLQY